MTEKDLTDTASKGDDFLLSEKIFFFFNEGAELLCQGFREYNLGQSESCKQDLAELVNAGELS